MALDRSRYEVESISLEDIVKAICDRSMTPEEASRRANESPDEIRSFISHLDYVICEVLNSGQTDRAVIADLSRFNDSLARRIGDRSLGATTAFTLFQTLPNDLLHIEEKVQLAEEAVPILEQEGREARTMGSIFYRTAVAFSNLALISRASEHKKMAVKYAQKALRLLSKMQAVDEKTLAVSHFMIGSYLSEIIGATVEDLGVAITHLKESLRMAMDRGDGNEIGQCLNNLGNTMRLLGVRTGDSSVLEEAESILTDTLPYKHEKSSRRRTEENLELTRKAIQRLRAGIQGWQEQEPIYKESKMTALLGLGESYLKESMKIQEESEQRNFIDRAMERFMGALKASKQLNDPLGKGRAEFCLGVALNRGRGTLEAAVGVCFLQAAARRYEAIDERRRLAAAYLNLGEGYSTILGVVNRATYLPIAVEYLELAWKEFEALGAKDETYQSLVRLATCLKLQGDAGDDAAWARSRELFQRAALSSGTG
jgi:tetratricopeptide (TPR) repeat protein